MEPFSLFWLDVLVLWLTLDLSTQPQQTGDFSKINCIYMSSIKWLIDKVSVYMYVLVVYIALTFILN